VRAAGERLGREGIAQPILLGDGALDPARDSRLGRVASASARPPPDQIRDGVHALDVGAMPTNFGAALVALGEADGAVSGAVAAHRRGASGPPSGPSARHRGARVSSAFYMVLPDDQVLTYTDCAVVPDPSAEELASIALAAARDRASLVGDEPRVAFLSYSTRGSAEGPDVERVGRRPPGSGSSRRRSLPTARCRSMPPWSPRSASGRRPARSWRQGQRAGVPDLDAGNIATS
jgi:phosphate acetyltransferase